VPAGLQEQPLLGVHPLGVPPRDPEEGRVEPVDAVDETAPFPVRLAVLAFLRREVGVVVPSIGRDFGDAVAALGQIAPERVQVVGLRVAPGEPDDRDGVLVLGALVLSALVLGIRGGNGRGQQARDPVVVPVEDDEAALGPGQAAGQDVQRVGGGQRRHPGGPA
jgi:hypothetical protein